MTKKNKEYESEKRPYAYAASKNKTQQRWHPIAHMELNRLFQGVGWIGSRPVATKGE